jgi:hypothetical protein
MLELKMIGQYLVIFVVLTWVGILLSHWKIRRIERELSATFEPNYCLLPEYELSPAPHRRRSDGYRMPIVEIDEVEAPEWANRKLGEKI